VKGKYRRPLFKPSHLGAKYPIVDFIVDVLAPDSTSLGFFFVQVKSTSRGNNPQDRLPIQVEAEKFNFLARLPAPTYLIFRGTTTAYRITHFDREVLESTSTLKRLTSSPRTSPGRQQYPASRAVLG
jgi:hypothetical protein